MSTSIRHTILSILISILSLSTFAGSKSHIFRLPDSLAYTELRFRLQEDLIIILVRVNNAEPMNFILDTGTDSPVILNRKYIKSLDLPLGRDISFQGAGTKDQTKGQVINGMRLQIADAYTDHIGGVVLYENPLSNLRINGIKIHGVLGASLFSSFAVEIDYPNQMLRLYRDTNFLQTRSFTAHQMEMSRSRPILKSELTCNEKSYQLDLMIDTGLNNELLIYDHSMFDYTRLPTEEIGKGYCGSVRASSIQVDMLKVAQLQLSNINAILPAANAYRSKACEISDRDGTIGNVLLKRFCVVLDYAESKFYVESAAESPYLGRFLADERR